MENKINKFENPARLGELNPEGTLVRAGFAAGMSICDIGAGSGIFSLPATRISGGNVFALEISEAMIEVLTARKAEQNIENLFIRKVESERLPLEDDSCDMVLMVTVFHEIENKDAMLKEISRVLKDHGKVVFIEFHKRKTPFGPPTDHRLGEEELKEICSKNEFQQLEGFTLGDNFYCAIFGE